MESLKNHPRYAEARRHVGKLRGFFVHATVFVAVNLGLLAVNLVTSPGRVWFGWATLGWGVGLLVHGLSVFAFAGWLGRDWEERRIRAYLERR